jgi:hypothetical protein
MKITAIRNLLGVRETMKLEKKKQNMLIHVLGSSDKCQAFYWNSNSNDH